MKKALLVAAIVSICFFSANTLSSDDGFPFGIGPYITLKGGINANSVPTGIKNDFNLNPLPDFGATIYFPLSSESRFGMTCDLGYSTYTYRLKWTDNPDSYWKDEFSYFTISPNLHLYGFMLGVAVGFPMNATHGKLENFLTTDMVATLFEVRIGGMIPVFESVLGRLNVLISGGYVLSGIFKDDQGYGVTKPSPYQHYQISGSHNPHPAWMSIGLSYLFNLNLFNF